MGNILGEIIRVPVVKYVEVKVRGKESGRKKVLGVKYWGVRIRGWNIPGVKYAEVRIRGWLESGWV